MTFVKKSFTVFSRLFQGSQPLNSISTTADGVLSRDERGQVRSLRWLDLEQVSITLIPIRDDEFSVLWVLRDQTQSIVFMDDVRGASQVIAHIVGMHGFNAVRYESAFRIRQMEAVVVWSRPRL